MNMKKCGGGCGEDDKSDIKSDLNRYGSRFRGDDWTSVSVM